MVRPVFAKVGIRNEPIKIGKPELLAANIHDRNETTVAITVLDGCHLRDSTSHNFRQWSVDGYMREKRGDRRELFGHQAARELRLFHSQRGDVHPYQWPRQA